MTTNQIKAFSVPALCVLTAIALLNGCMLGNLPLWNAKNGLTVALTVDSSFLNAEQTPEGRFLLPETSSVRLTVFNDLTNVEIAAQIVPIIKATDAVSGKIILIGKSEPMEVPLNMILRIEASIADSAKVVISRAVTTLMLANKEPQVVKLRLLPTAAHPALRNLVTGTPINTTLTARSSNIIVHKIGSSALPLAADPVQISFTTNLTPATLHADLRGPDGSPMPFNFSLVATSGLITYKPFQAGDHYLILYNDTDITEVLTNMTLTVPAASAKDILTFGFVSPAVSGVISGTNINIDVPMGTDETNLTAIFTTSGQTVTVSSVTQISAITVNDFSSPVTYTVTAEDGSTKNYLVTVTEVLSSTKEITGFSFASVPATGVITGTAIAVTVPFGTTITNLVPTITHNGVSISPNPSMPQDFSAPFVYTVTAADASTLVFTITVTIASNNAKDITTFGFMSPAATGIITGTNIAVTVPFGTNVTNLVPTITHTGASISPLASMPQDFSSPVVYTVTAADSSTQNYTVNVTIAANPAKEMLTFGFVTPSVSGVITGTNITVSVPNGTNVSSLVAIFTTSGTGVTVGGTPQISGTTANNFSAMLTYTVTAADLSTQDYFVNVTILPSNNADLNTMVLTGLSLTPGFSSANVSYTANANSSLPTTTVTPTKAHPGAILDVNVNGSGWTAVTSGTASGTLMLDAANGTNTVSVRVTAEDTITTKTYMITVYKTVMVDIQSGIGGTVTPAGSQERTPGTPVGISATPNPGYRFVSWTGTGTVANPTASSTTLTVNNASPITIMANFTPDFANGIGTVGDPYQIANLGQLANMNSFRSAAFILIANIDMSSQPNWVPIGDATTNFTGSFNGNGFTLANLTINAVSYENDRGFFGFVSNADLVDITLTNISITSNGNFTGGLVGSTLGTTTITDCSVSGAITGYQGVGGLVGNNDTGGNLVVLRCSAAVTITIPYSSVGTFGGLIGSTKGGSVTESFATGDIGPHGAGVPNAVGGLIGMNWDNVVTDCYATGNVYGGNDIGGLIGSTTYNIGPCAVVRSYSIGAVTGTGGGLIGSLGLGTTVTDSYYDSDTSGMLDSDRGQPETTTAMQLQATYVNWDFISVPVWRISAGTYPLLNWQP